MLSVQLDEGLEKRFEQLCAAVKRDREDCLREAIEQYMEDLEDIIVATRRLNDDDAETSEIMADAGLMESIREGRDQARQRIGRRIEEIDV